MSEDKRSFSLFGLLALLAFLSFLAFLIWQMRQQAGTLTLTEIQQAREIARRLEQ
jgi:cytoskeletal protein RodZ